MNTRCINSLGVIAFRRDRRRLSLMRAGTKARGLSIFSRPVLTG